MKFITVTDKTSFPGATLPLGRTNAGQYYVKVPNGQGPAVAIELLHSPDAHLVGTFQGNHGAELIISQASVVHNSEGRLQLVPQLSPEPNQQVEEAVLLWIPDLKESVEVNPGNTVGGISTLMENVSGTCDRICAGGLVRLTAHSSFMLTTYHNLDKFRKERTAMRSVQIQFHGRNEVYIGGEMPDRYFPKWV